MGKRLETKDGRLILTEENRIKHRSAPDDWTTVEISIPELRRVLRHAEKMKSEEGKKFNVCFKHLSPDVSFFIRLRPLKKRSNKRA